MVFTIRKMPHLHKKGVMYRLRSFPSKKAMKKMRTRLKEETASRGRLNWPLKLMVELLNPMIQGWRNYLRSSGCRSKYGKPFPSESGLVHPEEIETVLE